MTGAAISGIGILININFEKRLKVIPLIAAIIGSIFFFFASIFIGYSKVDLDLTKVDQIIGKVTSFEITNRVTKRYSLKQKVFRFDLDNYIYPFNAFRSTQEYSGLTNNIQINDRIKVYFYKGKKDNFVNDVYQIEKNDQILLDYQSYNKDFKFLVGYLLFAGIFILVYGIWKFKKSSK